MFFPEGQVRVHLCGQPCDMRKSYDGLQALARHAMGHDPLDGALYAFVNRRGTQAKVLYFDRSGFCIWAKRLEAARECCMQHSLPCDKRLWHTQNPWPS
jgi:transposase